MEYLVFILIAIVVGLLIGLIAANGEKSKLKSVAKNNRATAYVVQGSMKVTTRRDLYLYKELERTERPQQNQQNQQSQRK